MTSYITKCRFELQIIAACPVNFIVLAVDSRTRGLYQNGNYARTFSRKTR